MKAKKFKPTQTQQTILTANNWLMFEPNFAHSDEMVNGESLRLEAWFFRGEWVSGGSIPNVTPEFKAVESNFIAKLNASGLKG